MNSFAILPDILQQRIDAVIDDVFPQMVEVRRQLHRNPELSGQERQTSLMLYQRLGDLGFQVDLGPDGCGVLADMVPAAAWPRLALRADLDALRIHDTKDVPYRSTCDGVMHACGHDAHTALVFGSLAALQRLSTDGDLATPLSLRGIFQPAEETCAGAQDMMRVGALDGVAAILATHMDPSRQVGHVGVRTGVLTANCNEMEITVVGRGGHAARPHEAADPIAAAAQLITALYQFIPRATDSQDAVVVTIGQIEAGDNSNVIPESVTLRGTIRTLDATVRDKTFEHIRRLASGFGQASETRMDVRFSLGAESVRNDGPLTDLVRRAVCDAVGDQGLDEIPRPSMGSEDFAFYLTRVPGSMMRIGCRSQRTGGSPLHTPTFDIDEEALRVGAKVLVRSAIAWNAAQSAGNGSS